MSGYVGLLNYHVTYLLPFVEDAAAVEDAECPGFYRHTKVLAATSEREVVTEIIAKRGYVLSVEAEQKKIRLFSKISKDYRKQFLQAVQFNVRAGMSAGKALTVVIEAEAGEMRGQLNPALNILRSGGTFHEAIIATGMLDETTLAILEAGELTGNLRDALDTAIKHQDVRANEQKIMFGAVSWTVIDIVMSIVGIFGNIFGMLPSARDSMEKMSAAEAEKLKQALDIAYATNYVLLAGTFIAVAVIVFAIVGHTSPNLQLRRKADDLLSKVPLFSEAMVHSAIAGTSSVAHSLIKGGVPFLAASEIAQKSTRLQFVKDFWSSAHTRIQNGEPIARALAQPLLENAERLIIVAHTNREQLAHAFDLIATRRSELAAVAAKKFSMMAFIASMVYSGIAVVVTLWVTYIQYQAMMSATSNIGGGM